MRLWHHRVIKIVGSAVTVISYWAATAWYQLISFIIPINFVHNYPNLLAFVRRILNYYENQRYRLPMPASYPVPTAFKTCLQSYWDGLGMFVAGFCHCFIINIAIYGPLAAQIHKWL